jgi:hypothetical protein
MLLKKILSAFLPALATCAKMLAQSYMFLTFLSSSFNL